MGSVKKLRNDMRKGEVHKEMVGRQDCRQQSRIRGWIIIT